MTKITHAIAGLVVAAGCVEMSKNYPAAYVFPALAAGAIGGTFPDIDLFMGDARKDTVWKHRGIVHTPLFLTFLLILVAIGENRLFTNVPVDFFYLDFIFALSFLSHLLLDSLNIIGIMWFYPFSKKAYSLKLMKSGSLTEYGLVTLPLVAILVFLGSSFVRIPQIQNILFHKGSILSHFVRGRYYVWN